MSILFEFIALSLCLSQLIGRRSQNGNVESFCEQLVEKAGVMLLPGTLYGDEGNHFRIGFGRKNMPEALARLEEFMEKLPAATG